MDNFKSIIRSSMSFFFGTLISRFSGLARDLTMAFYFGTHPSIAAFLVAYRFSSLMRRLLGDSTLLAGFIPSFEGVRSDHPKQAFIFFRDTFYSLTLFLLLFITCVEGGLYWLYLHQVFSPGNQEILKMTLIMLPGLLFICLYGLNSALLHCERYFFLSSVAPVLFNCVWITAVLLIGHIPAAEAAPKLCYAILIAYFAQWIITFPKVFKTTSDFLTWKELYSCDPFSKNVRQMVKAISLGVIGIGATQINSALDALFARYASLEGPAYLTYAIRIQQVPLALFGIALSVSLLPALSRTWKSQEISLYTQTLRKTLSYALILVIPFAFSIFILAPETINLIYGRGDFSQNSTLQTALCLSGYSFGLIPMTLILLLTPAFHSKKDYWSPTIASIIAVFCNIGLNTLFVFVFGWGPATLAWSTTLSACVNMITLLYRAPIQENVFNEKMMIYFAKLLFSGSFALFIVYLFNFGSFSNFPRDFTSQLTQFLSGSCLFFIVFSPLAWFFRPKK